MCADPTASAFYTDDDKIHTEALMGRAYTPVCRLDRPPLFICFEALQRPPNEYNEPYNWDDIHIPGNDESGTHNHCYEAPNPLSSLLDLI